MADMFAGTRYRIQERAFSLGDDFWIETEDGERAFKVDAKAFADRGTSVLESAGGEELYTLRELEPGAVIEIVRRGQRVATVRKALVGTRHDYSIDVENGETLAGSGDLSGSELSFERAGETVARVSNPWLQVRHVIEVEIAPGEDDALLLASVVCLDWMGRG
jgi:uncharacterized protein YxjI